MLCSHQIYCTNSSLAQFAGPREENRVSAGLYTASLVAQMVKNLPAMQETWVLSLGQEDPLEKGMATHSTILAWRIPWIGEPGGFVQGTGQVGLYRVKGFLSLTP